MVVLLTPVRFILKGTNVSKTMSGLTKSSELTLLNFIEQGKTSQSYTEICLDAMKGLVGNSNCRFACNPFVEKFAANNKYAKVEPGTKSNIYKSMLKLMKPINNRYHKNFLKNLETGNYNSNPIEFNEAVTVEEAILFGKANGLYKKIRGLKNPDKSDLERLNALNKALIEVHNKTGGKSIMPRVVKFQKDLKSIDKLDANASYSTMFDVLTISRNRKLQPFTIYHEMGHANHSLHTDISSLMRLEEIKNVGGDTTTTWNFIQNTMLQRIIRKNMRSYAMTSPAEFVADRFALAIEGKSVPQELDLAYDALQGSDIIYSAMPLRLSA